MANEIHGLGELQATFKQLPIDMRDKHARRLVAVLGNVFKKEARAIVRQKGLIRTRALLNNIVIKRERNKPYGTEQYNLGVRHGNELGKRAGKFLAVGRNGRVVTRRVNDPFYWRFLEFGHKIIERASGKQGIFRTFYDRTTRKGKVRSVKREVAMDAISMRRKRQTGFVEATPFIKPAFESKREDALRAMEKEAIKLLGLSQK